MELWRKNRALFAIYVLTLLYALHYGIPLYVTSSYLSQYFSQVGVSLMYGIAAFTTLLASLHFSKYLKRYHTYGFTCFFVISEIIITSAFAVANSPLYLALFFIVHFLLQSILFMSLNVLVEAFTPPNQTGHVRGIFLTLLNIGILMAPFVGGVMLARFSYPGVYFASIAMLVPFLYFLYTYLKEIEDPVYDSLDLLSAWKRGWKNKDLRGALISILLLESFYALMIIYMPLYVGTLGISLPVFLAVIMPFALIPLIVFPYELGILADEKYGEKEMLILGLCIMCISLFIMGFMQTESVIFWALVLFLSRVGASFVETMSYTYYFKKISTRDSSLTSLFINIRGVAIIIVPSTIFLLSPLIGGHPEMIFYLLGIIIASSIHSILTIHDTK